MLKHPRTTRQDMRLYWSRARVHTHTHTFPLLLLQAYSTLAFNRYRSRPVRFGVPVCVNSTALHGDAMRRFHAHHHRRREPLMDVLRIRCVGSIGGAMVHRCNRNQPHQQFGDIIMR